MKHIFLKLRHNRGKIVLFSLIALFYSAHGCPIRLLTGISCPGCGMSRALTALLKFNFPLAFEMHPLVFLLPVAALIYFARRLIPQKILRLLYISALILLVTVYIVRMAQDGNVVCADVESGLLFTLFSKIKQINIF